MKTMPRRKLLGWGAALGLTGPLITSLGQRGSQAWAQTGGGKPGKPAPDKAPPVVLVGATLHRAGEPPLKGSVVRIEDGEIGQVATSGVSTAGARVINITGKQLTAGLVDPLTRIGVTEVSLEKSTRDDRKSQAKRDPIRAAFRTADGYNPASSLVNITRMAGVTSVGVVPSDGLITGVSAWADLAGDTQQQALAKAALALHVNFGHYAGNRSSAWLRLREVLDDAASYRKSKAGYERRQLRKLGVSRLDLETLVLALDGSLPVVFHVDRASDIERTLAFAKQRGLKAILASAAEAWKLAKTIAAAKVPAIVYPFDHGPRSFAALGAREDNAALLQRAGVSVALSSGESHNARKLRQVAGNAVRAGLPHAAAISAITQAPAQMFGLQERYGAIKEGRAANLVVWSGDPLEIATRVERMFIRGHAVTLRSRQTRLLERYR